MVKPGTAPSITGESVAPDERAERAGHRAFGPEWRPASRASAPGRIELIGNHLDYNGGPVLAAAIDREVMALVDANGSSDEVSVLLADVSLEAVTISISEVGDWHNPSQHIEPVDYARAVVATLISRGHGCLAGARLAVASDVPIGLGVSSSAALCTALSLALSASDLSPQERVLTAQEAEHRAGTPCGTMDQSASVAGGVICFDGASLDVHKLEPDLSMCTFVIADSGVDRSLGSSAYPHRVAESKRALELANTELDATLPHLAALTRDQLEAMEASGVMTGDLLRRCRHIVNETARVAEAEVAMSSGNWHRFGELMTESGRSSAGDYDVSHPRVEELVGEILATPNVLGARMMGGGGGGSVLALLSVDAVSNLSVNLKQRYFRAYGMADQPDAIQRCKFGRPASIEPFDAG